MLLSLTLLSGGGASGAVRQLRYNGELLQSEAGTPAVPVRSFVLDVWLTDAVPPRVIYRVTDEAGSGLPWHQQMGGVALDDQAGVGEVPQLQHVHSGRPYHISVPEPWMQLAAALEMGSTWVHAVDGREVAYEVVDVADVVGRKCWEVAGKTRIGHTHTLQLEQASGLLVEASQRVFIGQGERFELRVSLAGEQLLDEEQAGRELWIADRILKFAAAQSSTGDGAEQSVIERVATLAADLPALREMSTGTSWAAFVASMEVELAADQKRLSAVDALTRRLEGQPAPVLGFKSLKPGEPAELAAGGEVKVLHFYEYRGTPESPFGQVGYLDFLAGKGGDRVRVYGVAVDERLADVTKEAEVRRDVRTFSTQFMRLGYPVLLDDGSVLKSFGDPRPFDIALPVWVVIGADGNVLHYHAGLYDIDPNRGLEQLSKIINTAGEPR
ncbi:MAG: hypothetical protein R3B90_08920 [Planctomycetaceae bacterium]